MLIDGEDVKQAVVQRLLELFPDIAVYKEAKTSVAYPHFFVRQISVRCTEERNNYFLLSYSMQVRYRVAGDSSTDLNLERSLDNMSLKLMQGFDVIDFERSKIRCKDKSVEKVDGVLHLLFNVDIMAKLVSDEGAVKQNKLVMGVKLDGGQVH